LKNGDRDVWSTRGSARRRLAWHPQKTFHKNHPNEIAGWYPRAACCECPDTAASSE